MRKEEKAPERGSEGLRAERWGTARAGGWSLEIHCVPSLWGGRDGVNPRLMM